jgi:hypothetical protein
LANFFFLFRFFNLHCKDIATEWIVIAATKGVFFFLFLLVRKYCAPRKNYALVSAISFQNRAEPFISAHIVSTIVTCIVIDLLLFNLFHLLHDAPDKLLSGLAKCVIWKQIVWTYSFHTSQGTAKAILCQGIANASSTRRSHFWIPRENQSISNNTVTDGTL